MHQLLKLIELGLPESRHKFSPALREYFQFRKKLHPLDGVIVYKARIVIPPSLKPLLQLAHEQKRQNIRATEKNRYDS